MQDSVDRSSVPADARVYCSELARSGAATLIGTAEWVDVWILLEYSPPWRPKAVSDNTLPAAVNAWLDTAVKRLAAELQCNARVQFIRQPGRAGREPQLLIVQSGESRRAVHQFVLERPADVLAIDPVAVVRGTPGGVGVLIDVPIYLVCTHGQRDLCCARFGTPVYERLAALHGASVWQTTHIGGHRYAPNLVCLPQGLIYGFAAPDAAAAIVDATRHSEIVLDHLRGRSCYPAHVQVAELAVRRRTGVTFIDGLRLSGDRELDGAGWRVTFEVAGHGRLTMAVRRGPSVEVQASCGDGQTKRIEQYLVTDAAADA